MVRTDQVSRRVLRAKKEDTQSWRGAQKAAALLMFPGGNGTLK